MTEPLFITLLPVTFLTVVFFGERLCRRKPIDVGGDPPIGEVLFLSSKYSMLLVWAAVAIHSWGVDLSFTKVPNFLRWVGFCSWVFGFVLLFIGRFGLGDSFRIGSARERTNLRVDGLFRFSRNPMYVGVYATLLAAACYTLNPFLLVIATFVVAVHHKIVLAEEQHLRAVFGEQYAEYCRRVRRYL